MSALAKSATDWEGLSVKIALWRNPRGLEASLDHEGQEPEIFSETVMDFEMERRQVFQYHAHFESDLTEFRTQSPISILRNDPD
jgi:hypothetical protein